MKSNLIFYQLFEKETSTYTYLIGDPLTKEAILIDPVIEMVDRDTKLLNELDLKLKYILDTHVHADHVTSSGELRKRTGAKVGVSSAYDLSCADLHLEDGQELKLGEHTIKVIHTPGHTSGCLTYQLGDMIFTGDALLIRGCGRTDFQEGSSEKLFSSVREKLFNLPDETIIYPGHDYKGLTKSTIAQEKKWNSRLNTSISKVEFINIMKNLKLAQPKKIDEAVPANLVCGIVSDVIVHNTGTFEDIKTISARDLFNKQGQFKVIDVRGEDEFNNELGHIPGAELATLGTPLEKNLENRDHSQRIVFVCRSGKRSAEATRIALRNGFTNVYNLEGGMLTWTDQRFPFERDMGGS